LIKSASRAAIGGARVGVLVGHGAGIEGECVPLKRATWEGEADVTNGMIADGNLDF